jgi:glycerate 2-kinase
MEKSCLPEDDWLFFIKNRHMDNLKEIARLILSAAIDSVKPEFLIRRKVLRKDNLIKIGENSWDLNQYRHVYVIGAGKASANMAREMENILGDKLFYGQVTVKYGHGLPCRKVRILEAGHPLLDESGLEATSQILQLVQTAGSQDLVFCLLSGGGSALLEKLPEGISLTDLRKTYSLLLGCGADIAEMNSVRKHLSLVKGGQLAYAISPASCINLILSDVIGDPLDSIASGPTVADDSTFQTAWQVIEKYHLVEQLPSAVRSYLQKGLQGKVPETVKPDNPVFEKVKNIIIGNNLEALEIAQVKARECGFNTIILSSRIQGESREVAKVLVAVVKEIIFRNLPLPKPACLLLGGETTVTLRGTGKGGRNQELVLAALLAIQDIKADYLIMSCGTDGTDGPTDAAGGMVYPEIWTNARQKNLNARVFLENNNSYPFLEQTGGLIKTGPTGTNVMDILLALIP